MSWASPFSLTVVVIISAVLVVTGLLYFRARRSKRLVLTVSTETLPAKEGGTTPETVYYVKLEAKGRDEIPSTLFAGGRPMRILIDPPSVVQAGLPRYTDLEGQPVYASTAGGVPGLLSAVEIAPQTISSGMSVRFAVRNSSTVSLRAAEAPVRVSVRRSRVRRQSDSLEKIRLIAVIFIGVIAFVMTIASFFA